MIEKIRALFTKPATIIVEAAVIAVCAVGLILGGISDGAIAEIPKFAAGVVGAVEAMITLIQGLVKASDK